MGWFDGVAFCLDGPSKPTSHCSFPKTKKNMASIARDNREHYKVSMCQPGIRFQETNPALCIVNATAQLHGSTNFKFKVCNRKVVLQTDLTDHAQ